MIRFTGKDQHVVWLEPEGYDSGMWDNVLEPSAIMPTGRRSLRRRDISQWHIMHNAGGYSGEGATHNSGS